MRLITLDEAVQIVSQVFDEYVEPLAVSMMSGEVPSITFAIHRYGTKESDWLAHVSFKNSSSISTFKCDVYLEDIFRFCRHCRLWLITDGVFQVVALYYMLHPLYQSQYINFDIDVNADYESMMSGAGKETYNFIQQYCRVVSPVQQTVLDILKYHMMIFTNHYYGTQKHKAGRAYLNAVQQYAYYMHEEAKGAYDVARYRKAQTCLVDKDGFMIMERRTTGGIKHETEQHELNRDSEPDTIKRTREV